MTRLAACGVATCAALALGAPPALAGWVDGSTSENTYSDNCWSGSCYYEHATAQYVGYNAPASGGVPKVGEVYYVHEVVRALGNPNTTVYGVDVQLHLPANTYLAVSSANPIYCWLINKDGTTVPSDSAGYGCPTSASPGSWPYPSSGWWDFDPTSGAPPNHSPGLWYMSQGQGVVIALPVFSTVPLKGLSDNQSFLVGAVTVDPYSSLCGCGRYDAPPSTWNFNGVPSTGPWQAVTVDYNPPTIEYPAPASTTITASAAHTTGYLNDHFVPGTVYTDIGTTTSYGTSQADAIDGSYDAYHVDQDWNNLSGSTAYHWRLRFVPNGGSPACSPTGSAVCGADQTFTTAPGPPVGGGPGPGGGGTSGNGTSTGGSNGHGNGGGGGGSGGGQPGGPGQGPTPQTPAPKPSSVIATTAALQGIAGVTGDMATFVVSCSAAPGGSCPVSAQLVATEKLVGGKLAGISRNRRPGRQQVVVGSSVTAIAAGQTHKVVIPLNSQGDKLLAKFGRLPVTLTVALNPGSSSQSTVATQRVTFKATHRRKRR